jgi:26S proteasome regulatory subunit N13
LIWQAAPASTGVGSSNAGTGNLKFEWKDRRTNAKDLESTIFPEDGITFCKVGRESDRVYLMQYGSNSPERRHFFWLQDKSTEMDNELVAKLNFYLKDRVACATEAGDVTGVVAIRAAANADASTLNAIDGDALSQALQGAGGDAAGNNTPGSTGQVDALSSILENLGIPPPAASATPAGNPPSTAVTSSTYEGKQLTLADLQGAMAGLATTSPVASPGAGPPLNEVANADAVAASGIFEDEAVKVKLIALLPEGQQTEEHLMENLRSPQLQQSMKSLTSALAGDGGTFNEVIANFQMDPNDGAAALAAGNTIQAFLDCLLANVEKEKAEKKEGEEKMEE